MAHGGWESAVNQNKFYQWYNPLGQSWNRTLELPYNLLSYSLGYCRCSNTLNYWWNCFKTLPIWESHLQLSSIQHEAILSIQRLQTQYVTWWWRLVTLGPRIKTIYRHIIIIISNYAAIRIKSINNLFKKCKFTSDYWKLWDNYLVRQLPGARRARADLTAVRRMVGWGRRTWEWRHASAYIPVLEHTWGNSPLKSGYWFSSLWSRSSETSGD